MGQRCSQYRIVGAGGLTFLALWPLLTVPGPSRAQAPQTCTVSQVTNTAGSTNEGPSIAAGGTRVAFFSRNDLTGGNADGNGEVFTFATADGFTQVTSTTGPAGSNSRPAIDGGGTRIAFGSSYDLTPGSPGNADGNAEIFLFDTTGGFIQITNTTGGFNTVSRRSLNAAGSRIAFLSDRDLTPGSPGNADGNIEIFLFDTTSGFTQITNTTGGGFLSNARPSISADGTRIAFFSNRDLTPGAPGNADGNFEIFLFDTTSGLTQVTNTTGGSFGGNVNPEISGDGAHIVFYSDQDLTPGAPGNADGNAEIFVFHAAGGFTQITDTTGGSNLDPTINGDGSRIAFRSDRNLAGDNADGNIEIFLFDTTGGFTQITSIDTIGHSQNVVSISADGTRVAFDSNRDVTPGSPGNTDANFEIFLATCPVRESAPAPVPTLSEWAMLLLAGILLAGGLMGRRRRPPVRPA